MTTIPHLTFVIGGARSGKTAFAEGLAAMAAAQRSYIATAEPLDEEMAMRIALHRKERGESWETVEAPRDLAGALARVGAGRSVLIDCLTLWLSNLIHDEADWAAALEGLLDDVSRRAAPVVMVSNELGLGLVPETALGRSFRDAQGRVNQSVAARAGKVVFVAAGLPLVLKEG